MKSVKYSRNNVQLINPRENCKIILLSVNNYDVDFSATTQEILQVVPLTSRYGSLLSQLTYFLHVSLIVSIEFEVISYKNDNVITTFFLVIPCACPGLFPSAINGQQLVYRHCGYNANDQDWKTFEGILFSLADGSIFSLFFERERER